MADDKLGLALSGGGIRAMLFHLGLIRNLRQTGLLQRITHICSVSGGSIIAAHLVLNWKEFAEGDFDKAASKLLRFARFGVRNRIMRRYPALALRSRLSRRSALTRGLHTTTTALLMQHYERLLFGKATLRDLRPVDDGRPVLHILTTNLTTGTLCAFSPQGYIEPHMSHKTETPTVALAVAASSGFPGFFSPIHVTAQELGLAEGQVLVPSTHSLTDGGVYDNLGIRQFHELNRKLGLRTILVSDAGIEFQGRKEREFQGPIETALRAADVLTHRIARMELDYAQRIQEDPKGGERFLFVRLNDEVGDAPPIEGAGSPHSATKDASTLVWDRHALPHNVQIQLRHVRTDLDDFTPLEINSLARHGYCIGKKQLSDLVPKPLDEAPWVPYPRLREHAMSIEKRANLLRNAAMRRTKLISLSDPVCWFYGLLLLALLGGIGWLVYFFITNRP